MVEFDYNFISILFGISGTFILLFSNILSYRSNIQKKEKFSLMSQLIGFLFLFNSFLYLLWPKISSQIGSIPPITEFSYWPYYLFIFAGILISLFLVREENSGWGLEVAVSPKSKFELGIFFSPVVFAFLIMILNSDFLLVVTIFAWIKFMEMLWKRN